MKIVRKWNSCCSCYCEDTAGTANYFYLPDPKINWQAYLQLLLASSVLSRWWQVRCSAMFTLPVVSGSLWLTACFLVASSDVKPTCQCCVAVSSRRGNGRHGGKVSVRHDISNCLMGTDSDGSDVWNRTSVDSSLYGTFKRKSSTKFYFSEILGSCVQSHPIYIYICMYICLRCFYLLLLLLLP